MIEQVELHNFQSHPHTMLDFHKGVNAIIGDSDKGKTAILRSLYWVLTNRPSGVSVVSDWARDEKGKLLEACSVRVRTTNGEVIRKRDKDFNGYYVDGVELEAVGVDVPDTVSELLNIDPVNIQRQLDAPFLLAESPGEVARFFNRVVKLDEIDECLSMIEARKRSTNAELKVVVAQESKLTKELEAYSWVDKAAELVQELSATELDLNKSQQDSSRLLATINSYAEHDVNSKAIGKWLTKAELLVNEFAVTDAQWIAETRVTLVLTQSIEQYVKHSEIVKSTGWIGKAEALLHKLTDIANELEVELRAKQALDASIRKYNEAEALIGGVNIDELEAQVQSYKSAVERLELRKSSYSKLMESIYKYEEHHTDHENLTLLIKTTERELAQAREASKFCPTCGKEK